MENSENIEYTDSSERKALEKKEAYNQIEKELVKIERNLML
jgi:hypothetical protein